MKIQEALHAILADERSVTRILHAQDLLFLEFDVQSALTIDLVNELGADMYGREWTIYTEPTTYLSVDGHKYNNLRQPPPGVWCQSLHGSIPDLVVVDILQSRVRAIIEIKFSSYLGRLSEAVELDIRKQSTWPKAMAEAEALGMWFPRNSQGDRCLSKDRVFAVDDKTELICIGVLDITDSNQGHAFTAQSRDGVIVIGPGEVE